MQLRQENLHEFFYQFRSDLIRSDLDLIRSDLVRSDLDLIRSDLIRTVRIETGGGLPWERLGAGKGGWAFAVRRCDRCDGSGSAGWARVEGTGVARLARLARHGLGERETEQLREHRGSVGTGVARGGWRGGW
uniref:Uncharacterized protein n=1 Tax=Fagus sylvatica TaxID=28930 RepID=A0A2N9IFM3_FAGSY